MNTLKEQLAAQSYRLRRVIHLRTLKQIDGGKLPPFAPDYAIKAMGLGNLIDPRGGSTIAVVQNEAGRTVHAVAECHKQDGYNKKTGRSLAVARALEMFKLV